MSLSHKRKFKTFIQRGKVRCQSPDSSSAVLAIEAHEADLIYGRQDTAATLEAPDPSDARQGSALIQWQPDSGGESAWVDRYDARLLLSSLQICTATPPPAPPSPTGWSDLPSDAEDTFFLSATETDDYRRAKRRRMIDASHAERMRTLRAADPSPIDTEDPAGWASDEAPDEAQRELMRRTAVHVRASPNPAQLEMRILANHGADVRFSFLRGRWKRAWAAEKARARLAAQARAAPAPVQSIGRLIDYGDSDEESQEALQDQRAPPQVVSEDKTPRDASQDNQTPEGDVMEARRQRAREWAAKRREAKS